MSEKLETGSEALDGLTFEQKANLIRNLRLFLRPTGESLYKRKAILRGILGQAKITQQLAEDISQEDGKRGRRGGDVEPSGEGRDNPEARLEDIARAALWLIENQPVAAFGESIEHLIAGSVNDRIDKLLKKAIPICAGAFGLAVVLLGGGTIYGAFKITGAYEAAAEAVTAAAQGKMNDFSNTIQNAENNEKSEVSLQNRQLSDFLAAQTQTAEKGINEQLLQQEGTVVKVLSTQQSALLANLQIEYQTLMTQMQSQLNNVQSQEAAVIDDMDADERTVSNKEPTLSASLETDSQKETSIENALNTLKTEANDASQYEAQINKWDAARPDTIKSLTWLLLKQNAFSILALALMLIATFPRFLHFLKAMSRRSTPPATP